MFERIVEHVNAPIVVVNDQLRREKLGQNPNMVLEQGGFATIYRPLNLYPGMVGYSICPFMFNQQTRELIQRDQEFPSIMLDDRVFPYLTEEEIEAAVAHEIAHVEHGDYFKNLPLDPMHQARLDIEIMADQFSARLMGNPAPVINMICKLRYALPSLLGSCGMRVQETVGYVKAIDTRIAALNAIQ